MQIPVDGARRKPCDLFHVRTQHIESRLFRQPLWHRDDHSQHDHRNQRGDPEDAGGVLAYRLDHGARIVAQERVAKWRLGHGHAKGRLGDEYDANGEARRARTSVKSLPPMHLRELD